jgi:branched-chain amino acid transport system ATP-binding protein
MSILSVEHINTGYDKKQVLFDINFNIKQGECVLLVGSNGSGKSTLFKAIYRNLDLWDKNGKIIYNDEDITKLTTHELIKKGIVYIPQRDELFEDLTVLENLELCILHLNDKKDTKERIKTVLDQIPILKQILKQDINNLSGGERKLLSLAMALLNKPKLLLYDEPLSGLSNENIESFIIYLKEIKEQGNTIIFVEHRIIELLQIADRIIGIKLGRINSKELKSLDDIKEIMI